MQHAILPVLRPQNPTICLSTAHKFTVTRSENTRSSMDLNMSNFDSKDPQNRWLHFHKFYLGWGTWEGGGVLRGGDLQVPPIGPSRKPGVRLDRVVRPAGTLLSPTLSPQTLPCPQRTLTTNDPKTFLSFPPSLFL